LIDGVCTELLTKLCCGHAAKTAQAIAANKPDAGYVATS
jgi:hypothetical protein